jgi:Trypsin
LAPSSEYTRADMAKRTARAFLISTAVPAFALLGGFACSNAGTKDAERQVGNTVAGRGPLGQTRQAISGGMETTAYPFAVGINIANQGVCSGTLIAPNLVLTARHCVSQLNTGDVIDPTSQFFPPYPRQAFGVTTDANLFNGNERGVSKIIVPSVARAVGNDIALLILSSNVPASEAATVTPVVQHALSNQTRYNQRQNLAIGYGITGPGATDSGLRRFRRAMSMLCLDGSSQMFACVDNTGARIVEPSEFVSGAGVCQGDSGSGFFDQIAFDQGIYFTKGVLSRGPGTSCDNGVYTRTDSFKALIVAAGIEAAQRGGYPAPAWTVDEPQDAQDAPQIYPPPRPTRDAGPKPDSGAVDAGGNPSSSSSGAPEPAPEPMPMPEPIPTEPSSGAPAPPAAPKASGESCLGGEECESGTCEANLCVDPTPEPLTQAQPVNTQVSAGCNVQPDPTKPVPWRAGLPLVLAMLGLRLKRPRRT